MPVIAKRALGALLAVLGLALAATGGWFVSHLGTTGTATFTTTVEGDRPVVLGPSVLNRVDVPVTVRATAADGADVWIGRSSPSDAETALEGGQHTAVTGVAVREWALVTDARDGEPAPDLGRLDLWGAQSAGPGAASMVVQQDGVPETVVITAPGEGSLATVEASWPKRTWFYQSVVVIVAGLLLALVGGLTLWQTSPSVAASRAGGRHRLDLEEERS